MGSRRIAHSLVSTLLIFSVLSIWPQTLTGTTASSTLAPQHAPIVNQHHSLRSGGGAGGDVDVDDGLNNLSSHDGSGSGSGSGSRLDINLDVFLMPGDSLMKSSSCVHRYASVEMVNTHKTEPITIYAMDAIPDNNNNIHDDTTNVVFGRIPQISTSYFGNRVIDIPPEESAMIPIKFFPQIPSYYNDCNNNDNGNTESSSSTNKERDEPWHSCLTRAAAADFDDLGGSGFMDWTNTQNVEHEVHATLIVRTSRGTQRKEVTASAYKDNPYRIPHSILFHGDGFVSSSDYNFKGRENAYHYDQDDNYGTNENDGSNGRRTLQYEGQFEFDLFMDNAHATEELRLIEVFVSQEDLFDVRYKHSGGRGSSRTNHPTSQSNIGITSSPTTSSTLSSSSSSSNSNRQRQHQYGEKFHGPYFRYNNCGPAYIDIHHCNKPHSHDMKGPIVIPPNGKKVYVATLILKRSALTQSLLKSTTPGSSSSSSSPNGGNIRSTNTFLGYLQLVTSRDELSIVMEFKPHENQVLVTGTDNDSTSSSSSSSSSSTTTTKTKTNAIKASDPNKFHATPARNSTIILDGKLIDFTKPKESKKHLLYTCDAMNHHRIGSRMKQNPNKYLSGGNQIQDEVLTRVSSSSSSSSSSSTKTKTTTTTKKSSKVSVSPTSIDFGVFTSKTDKIQKGISITNHGDFPLHLMRARTSVDLFPHIGMQESINNGSGGEDVTLEKLAIFPSINIPADYESRIIRPGQTVENIAVLFVVSNSDMIKVHDGLPLIYHGSVIIHTGPVGRKYNDWRQEAINDPIAANEYIVETAFTVRFVYGHIEYSVEDMYFPAKHITNQNVLEYANPAWNYEASKCAKSFDRAVDFKSSFTAPMQITNARVFRDTRTTLSSIAGDFCEEQFQILHISSSSSSHNKGTEQSSSSSSSSNDNIDVKDDLGTIIIRYTYPEEYGLSFFRRMKRCFLSIETDLAGEFSIPMWIFSGLAHIKPEESINPIECQSNHVYTLHEMETGMGCLETVHSVRPIGTVLAHAFNETQSPKRKRQTERKKGTDTTTTTTTTTFGRNSLEKQSEDFLSIMGSYGNNFPEKHLLDPIVLSLGVVESDTIKTSSIFVSNFNPIPLTITAVVPSIEGMEIRLGRTIKNLAGYLQTAATKMSAQAHFDSWLKEYLPADSDNIFGSQVYRDDILLSHLTPSGLRALYHESATVRIHKKGLEPRKGSLNLEQKMSSRDVSSVDPKTHSLSFLGTMNGETFNVTHNFKLKDPPMWTIPPGGVARLEVLVRSPPASAMKERHFMDFVSTGVVLKTNFGQHMPLVAEYRSLTGQLEMSVNDSSKTNLTDTVQNWLDIPSIIRPTSESNEDKDVSKKKISSNSPFKSGVHTVIKNSFPREVEIKDVYSCNNWFQVHIEPQSPNDAKETFEAYITSSVSCLDPTNGISGSFFECALMWLEKRYKIQHNRCEMNAEEAKEVNSLDYNPKPLSDGQIETLRQNLAKRLKSVLSYLDQKYNETSKEVDSSGGKEEKLSSKDIFDSLAGLRKNAINSGNDGTIPFHVVDLFREALNGWDTISNLGMNVVTGNIRADIEVKSDTYKNSDSEGHEKHEPLTMSTSLISPNLRSSLVIPRIYHPESHVPNLLRFNTTLVATVDKLYVPVRNPTGFPLRIRLATIVPQTKDQTHFQLNSGSSIDTYFYVQTNSNEPNPWWTGGSYYLADDEGNLIISSHNVTLKAGKGATLGLKTPSLQSTTALSQGCDGRRCGYTILTQQNKQSSNQNQRTPIGASAATGEVLQGRLYDRDGGENKHYSQQQNTKIASLLNPFALGSNSIQEIIIPPFETSQVGPVFFRPPSQGKFTSTIFLENNLTGLETINVEGRGGWEKVIIFDGAAVDMKGDDVETRFGRPTLVFSEPDVGCVDWMVKTVVVANVGDTLVEFGSVHLSDAENNPSHRQRFDKEKTSSTSNKCARRGFRLLGCNEDVSRGQTSVNHSWLDKVSSLLMLFPQASPSDSLKSKSDQTKGNYLFNGFSLAPNETQVLHISYTPDYTFRSVYLALNFEYKRSHKTSFQEDNLQLLLGFDMGPKEARNCIRPNFIIRLPSAIQIIASLIPLSIFIFILVDILYGARQRKDASISHHGSLTGSKKWGRTYHYLSRVEPNSSDLEHIGREQTRQMLARYRQRGVIPPRCILNNGTFVRKRLYSATNSESNDGKSMSHGKSDASSAPGFARRNNGPTHKSLSDSIFSRYRDSSKARNAANVNQALATPCGIGWRETYNWIHTSKMNRLQNERRNTNIKRSVGENQLDPGKASNSSSVTKKVQFRSSNTSSNREKVGSPKRPVTRANANKTAPREIKAKPIIDVKTVSPSKQTKTSTISPTIKSVQTKKKSGGDISPKKLIQEIATTTKTTKEVSLEQEQCKPQDQKRSVSPTTSSVEGYKKKKAKDGLKRIVEAKQKSTSAAGTTKQIEIEEDQSATDVLDKKINDTYERELSKSVVQEKIGTKQTAQSSPKSPSKMLPDKLDPVEPVQDQLDESPTLSLQHEKQPGSPRNVTPELPTTNSNVSVDSLLDQEYANESPDDLLQTDRVPSAEPSLDDETESVDPVDQVPSADNSLNDEITSVDKVDSTESSLDDETASADKASQDTASPTVAIRPPPGLAPPPGFIIDLSTTKQSNSDENVDATEKETESNVGLDNSLAETDSSLIDAVNNNGDDKEKVGESDGNKLDDLFSAMFNEDALLGLSATDMAEDDALLGLDLRERAIDDLLHASDPPESVEGEPLLGMGTGQDFNVMGVLDFLNESNDIDETDMNDGNMYQTSSEVEDSIPGLNYEPIPSELQANPWGSETGTSRAFAYGIEVEGEAETQGVQDNVPLLNPDLLLSMNGMRNENEDDESDRKKDVYLNDGFFSDLLEKE